MTNFEKLKNFVYDYIDNCDCVNTKEEVINFRGIAFGAVLFFQRMNEVSYDELHNFWEFEAYDKFTEKIKEKKR